MTQSAQAVRREALTEVTWESINEPGAYVEKGSGDLYRIPKEALIPGASPAIVKESRGASVLVRLSEDPFLTTFRARLLCAQHNIEATFSTHPKLRGGASRTPLPEAKPDKPKAICSTSFGVGVESVRLELHCGGRPWQQKS